MERVLLIDDQQSLVDITAEYLSEYGFQVLKLVNSPETRDKVLQHEPHIIVSDIAMPALNGLQVAKLVCEMAPILSVKPYLLAYSTYSDKSTIKSCCESGFDFYLSKTRDPIELIHTLISKPHFHNRKNFSG